MDQGGAWAFDTSTALYRSGVHAMTPSRSPSSSSGSIPLFPSKHVSFPRLAAAWRLAKKLEYAKAGMQRFDLEARERELEQNYAPSDEGVFYSLLSSLRIEALVVIIDDFDP